MDVLLFRRRQSSVATRLDPLLLHPCAHSGRRLSARTAVLEPDAEPGPTDRDGGLSIGDLFFTDGPDDAESIRPVPDRSATATATTATTTAATPAADATDTANATGPDRPSDRLTGCALHPIATHGSDARLRHRGC
ncbi:unnamed protein product [Protopolystoma xenopodis]|uniref:Uncharacterized protein n=1 Tax=Protopolystoma xenopodis TaxID=117903 RepID=A0A448WYL4_9PLAT|nr:unnamed protein product [Protopolystoma xenopodis]